LILLVKPIKDNMDINAAIAELDKLIAKKGLSYVLYISSKLHAAIGRKGEDYEDLLFLKPSVAEIEIARKYVLKQKSDVETSKVFINAWVKELKNDLGYN